MRVKQMLKIRGKMDNILFLPNEIDVLHLGSIQ